MVLWTYDPKSFTYSVGSMTPREMSAVTAALIAGYAIVNSDTLGAEAARRNLMNHLAGVGDTEANRLLEVFIAADAHRIHSDGYTTNGRDWTREELDRKRQK
jgi:hypothetical protein